jgi:hypothetical protein
LLPKLHQLASTFSALEDVQIVQLYKIRVAWGINESLEGGVIRAPDPLGIRIVFERIPLESLEESCIVVIVFRWGSKIVHWFLSSAPRPFEKVLFRTSSDT